jgi:Domain of Unknown Function (DUF1080)
MRHPITLACLLTGLALTVFLRAEDKPAAEAAKPVEEAKANATELFDGKTLKNWKVPEFGGDGKVTVEDGKLIIGQGEPMTGVTWAGEDLPRVDYEISFEAQRLEGNDFFGTISFPVQKDTCSFVLGGWGGGVTGLSSLDGNSAIENQTTGYHDFEKGKWYKVRVRVTKTKMEVWLDDKEEVSVDYTDKKVGIRIEVELSKPLGFTTYRTTGAIRAVKLMRLDEGVK